MENKEIISATPQAENFTVRFNHQDLQLTPDEAVEFAQKGLKLESLQPVINELNYLAYLRGKSPLDTIREYVDLDGKIREAQLKEEFKDDETKFNDALNSYKNANELKKKEFLTESKLNDFKERSLVEGFFELREKCPEIESFDEIPEEVLKNTKNTSLLNSYLQYFHDQQMKITKNQKNYNENLLATAGEFRENGENTDSLLTQFIKGINK